jgi:hypothetical protein
LAQELSSNATIQTIEWDNNLLGLEEIRMMLEATATRPVPLSQDLYFIHLVT